MRAGRYCAFRCCQARSQLYVSRGVVPRGSGHVINPLKITRQNNISVRNSHQEEASQLINENSLAGQRYHLTLDIGRERHTWMDPNWAASGRRVEVPLIVEFDAEGTVRPLGVGAFAKLEVSQGQWQQQGDTLRFWINTGGLSRGDVTLPEGKLYISVPAWGQVLSKDKGTLTVKQRRWLVREESRLVGRLRVKKIEEGSSIEMELGPTRMKNGSLDGPLYFGGDNNNAGGR